MRLLLPLAFFLPTSLAAEPPKVMTDIAPVHSLVAQIMGDVATPDVLVTGGASPHDFQFTFDQADAVQNADLIIWIGESLTPWLEESLDTLSADATQIELLHTEGWDALDMRDEDDFEAFLEGDDHDHDHGHEDDHGEHHAADPHAWLDPVVAKVWLDTIAQALIAADPENEATYRANLITAQADMDALITDVETILAGTEDATFLVPHDAYQYFGARFNRPALAAISLSDASAPAPDQIAALQDIVASKGVTCILSDPQARSEWSVLVAEGTDARTALADPVGGAFAAGPDQYRNTVIAVANAYAECLGG